MKVIEVVSISQDRKRAMIICAHQDRHYTRHAKRLSLNVYTVWDEIRNKEIEVKLPQEAIA